MLKERDSNISVTATPEETLHASSPFNPRHHMFPMKITFHIAATSCGVTQAIIVSSPFSSGLSPIDSLSTLITILMGKSIVDILPVPPIMQMPAGNSSS
mmetsp:Transcript_13516/g.24446  ORF Transcript_13516/g.24446 Transcript_13516/m.24446 type:complete len:99 (+) Transcript_13516:178-474(+)